MYKEEIKEHLIEKLNAKIPYFTIKSELLDKGAEENVIDIVFMEALKVIKNKIIFLIQLFSNFFYRKFN